MASSDCEPVILSIFEPHHDDNDRMKDVHSTILDFDESGLSILSHSLSPVDPTPLKALGDEVFDEVSALIDQEICRTIESIGSTQFFEEIKDDCPGITYHQLDNGQFVLLGTLSGIINIQTILKELLSRYKFLRKVSKNEIVLSDKELQMSDEYNHIPTVVKLEMDDLDEISIDSLTHEQISDTTVVSDVIWKHERYSADEIHSVSKNLQNKSTEKRFCRLCQFEARDKPSLLLHHTISHRAQHICPKCPYSTGRKSSFRRHFRAVHENRRPHQCALCDAAFKRPDSLKQHQIVHFGDERAKTPKSVFCCSVCKKIVRSAAYLREHMLTHSDDRTFLCEVCGASFKTRSVHRNHLQTAHGRRPKPLCRICGKSFASPFSLSRHSSQQHFHNATKKPSFRKDSSFNHKHVKTKPEASSVVLSIELDNQIPFIIESQDEIVQEFDVL